MLRPGSSVGQSIILMAKFAGSIPNQGTHKYQPMNSPPAPTFLSLSKINNKCLNIHKSGRQKVHMPLNMVTLQEVDIEAPSLSTLGLGRLSRQGNHVIISLYCSNTLLLIDKSLASVAHILPIAIQNGFINMFKYFVLIYHTVNIDKYKLHK